MIPSITVHGTDRLVTARLNLATTQLPGIDTTIYAGDLPLIVIARTIRLSDLRADAHTTTLHLVVHAHHLAGLTTTGLTGILQNLCPAAFSQIRVTDPCPCRFCGRTDRLNPHPYI